jgi:hypothetical protein
MMGATAPVFLLEVLMSIERLVKEFSAQDVGAWMTVFREGKHTRVAKWTEGAGWIPTEDGASLLATGGIQATPETDREEAHAAKFGRKPKVKTLAAAFGDDE